MIIFLSVIATSQSWPYHCSYCTIDPLLVPSVCLQGSFNAFIINTVHTCAYLSIPTSINGTEKRIPTVKLTSVLSRAEAEFSPGALKEFICVARSYQLKYKFLKWVAIPSPFQVVFKRRGWRVAFWIIQVPFIMEDNVKLKWKGMVSKHTNKKTLR